MKVVKHTLYVFDIDVGATCDGSKDSTTALRCGLPLGR